MLEMTPDALTNAGKQVTLTIAHACSQGYTNDSVFSLAQMTLCIMTFPPFVGPNIISDGPKKGLPKRQFTTHLEIDRLGDGFAGVEFEGQDLRLHLSE